MRRAIREDAGIKGPDVFDNPTIATGGIDIDGSDAQRRRQGSGTVSLWQCPKCLWKYRSPIAGTNGVAHVCSRTRPKHDLTDYVKVW